jgi:putative transposase
MSVVNDSVTSVLRQNCVRSVLGLIFAHSRGEDRRVPDTLLLIARALALACRVHRELILENLALRQQLRALQRSVKRPRLRRRDRIFWIALAGCWRRWRTALLLVQPETVVRWHREWLRRRWHRRSRPRRQGRPSVDQDIRTLVGEMATANPLWGAPRIHGELQKLGLGVSERTVSRLMPRRRRPPSQTWRTFLANHVTSMVSMDFFTVSTLTGRVLFVLVILAHERRRVVHVNVTEHPTAAWTAQQVVDAFPDDTAPRWLLRDRDSIYSDAFHRRAAAMGIEEVVSAPLSPWQSPYVERFIGSIRRECLDHVIVLNRIHLRRLLSAYLTYYHRSRTHLALDKDAPDGRSPCSGSGNIVVTPEVGGLHHRYDRQAA